MIHDVGVALQAKLREFGYGAATVLDAEQTKPTTRGRERIVIEHDLQKGDSFSNSRSQRPNPVHIYTRNIAVKITVYAQSPRSGAQDFEHRRRAEHIVDLVLVALDFIAAGDAPIFNVWTPNTGGFVISEDLEGSERWGGAVYEMAITISRAVRVQTWAGDIADEATLGTNVDTALTREVSIGGADDFETF